MISDKSYPLLAGSLFVVCTLAGCADLESGNRQGATTDTLDDVEIIRFADISQQAGLGEFRHHNAAYGNFLFPEQMGSGGGFIDYDGDGWLDILLVGGGSLGQAEATEVVQALRLYRNNGDGTFTEVTAEAGLGDIVADGTGIVAADYNNNGLQDFYFTTIGRNMLFRNNGDGTFTEVGEEAGVSNQEAWSSTAIFFDSNRNGQLDLFVANYAEWSLENDVWCSMDGVNKSYCNPRMFTGIPGKFYTNNGDGTFTDRTAEAGFLNSPGMSLGVAEFDFNGNGWPDLAVANDGERDLLYINNGDGTFSERGTIAGMAYGEHGEARAGMGIDVGDVDNSGEATIVVTNFSYEMVGVYRQIGEGLFADRAAASRIGRSSLRTLAFGTFLLDFNLNGFLDLYVANGHVYPGDDQRHDDVPYAQPSHLFVNRKDGTFMDAAPEVGGVFQKPLVGRGAAFADVTRNGLPDMLVTENGGPVHLWRNDVEGRNFLRVRLEGRESSRDGIGSNVVAYVGDMRMHRRIRTGSSYLSQSELTATFGLDQAAAVDSLIITWPSGHMEKFFDVPAGRELLVIENSGSYEEIPLPGRERSLLAESQNHEH